MYPTHTASHPPGNNGVSRFSCAPSDQRSLSSGQTEGRENETIAGLLFASVPKSCCVCIESAPSNPSGCQPFSVHLIPFLRHLVSRMPLSHHLHHNFSPLPFHPHILSLTLSLLSLPKSTEPHKTCTHPPGRVLLPIRHSFEFFEFASHLARGSCLPLESGFTLRRPSTIVTNNQQNKTNSFIHKLCSRPLRLQPLLVCWISIGATSLFQCAHNRESALYTPLSLGYSVTKDSIPIHPFLSFNPSPIQSRSLPCSSQIASSTSPPSLVSLCGLRAP